MYLYGNNFVTRTIIIRINRITTEGGRKKKKKKDDHRFKMNLRCPTVEHTTKKIYIYQQFEHISIIS